MAAGLENVFEDSEVRSRRPRGAHISIEVNNRCPFADESACGADCILIARNAPSTNLLNRAEILHFARELFDLGSSTLHFNVAGMEPLAIDSSGANPIVFELLQEFHARPESERPLTFNMASSGYRLRHFAERFAAAPLSSLVISVDHTASSGLRVTDAGDAALLAGLRVKCVGGCERLCVNTVLADGAEDDVLAIGGRLVNAGSVDQWMISPLMQRAGTTLKSVIPGPTMAAFARRIVSEMSTASMMVLIDVPHTTLVAEATVEAAAGRHHVFDQGGWCWRLPLGDGGVMLQAWNPRAKFARARWDGQVLQQGELHEISLAKSRLGRYHPGLLHELVATWSGSSEALEV